MAKKTKNAETSTKQTTAKPVDPVKTQNLLRLLNTLALLLAIGAFLLQLFAVLSHKWKWQTTDLYPLASSHLGPGRTNVYQDSRIDQHYGLYSRDVKVFGNNDEQVGTWASTRFPRIDDGDEHFAHCLSQSSSLRGAFLTCSNRLNSSPDCHCRRYHYWNWVIFFEVTALVLLGIAVFLIALLRTQFGPLLKLAAAGLSILAFIFLLIGLILILTHLKRETRSIADAYPHIYSRLTNQLGANSNQNRPLQYQNRPYRRAVRRQTKEVIRAYTLLPGQYAYNDTHFQEYSERSVSWVFRPYTSLAGSGAMLPTLPKQRPVTNLYDARRDSTAAPVVSRYGPAVGYNDVYDNTRAGIGCSTILSILATILSLLLPLLLLFSWLTGKKAGPDTTKTVTTTTTYKQEYVAVPTNVPQETIAARNIPVDYNPQRPIGEAIVTARNPQQSTPYDINVARSDAPVIVRDVIIRDDSPEAQLAQERSGPVTVDSSQMAYRS